MTSYFQDGSHDVRPPLRMQHRPPTTCYPAPSACDVMGLLLYEPVEPLFLINRPTIRACYVNVNMPPKQWRRKQFEIGANVKNFTELPTMSKPPPSAKPCANTPCFESHFIYKSTSRKIQTCRRYELLNLDA